ncbi:MAG: sel1 repeat family protein [Alphaproteobacteria bacterium]|nr:sel1 repeat family protein [Alphaproteobacteria bacterium]
MKFGRILTRAYFIFGAIIFAPSFAHASFGLSLEELYRQVVMEENQGRLPAYFSGAEVRQENRNRIDVSVPTTGDNIIGVLESDVYESEEVRKQKERQEWLQTVLAVKKGSPTPFDVAKIERLADLSNPEAVEMLAWLYATGTGVPKNLPKAMSLYNKAAYLGVPQAKANAENIYKSLSSMAKRKK